jgi:hypothetical protein
VAADAVLDQALGSLTRHADADLASAVSAIDV